MKNWNFWVQLFVSAAIPTVIGSGLIFIFSQFRERLPDWAYNLIISIVSIFFVIVLAVLVLLLIQLAFGDWFVKLRRWYEHRSYYKNRSKISEDWRNKWISLSETLLNANSNDWRVSDEEQNKYRSLRNWLRLNRSKFLPIWGLFRQNREPAAHERVGSSSDLMHKVFDDSYEDPFSYFYSPFAIEAFEGILGYKVNEMPVVLVRLKEQLDELIEWVKLK